ncbi:MAG TPA: DNA polymerase III subunit gamma/tau [Burkholderiales bacterium]|nr:DNA polymerase III subunit gamma/tau [Burkholderiales bacterium]
MTQVLARKWRPRIFSELVGQEHVVRALENALTQQRLHHAYLFTGTRGVGKTTLARIIAKALNCETGVTATPCGRCSACTEIDAGRFIDLLELDAASNTQVDNMRELLENALYAPTAGRYKVYIIDEVHMLSRNAFNAMLKTLEEPPAHVKFILATTDPQKVPVTVLSRCLQFNLKQIPQQQIRGRLQHVLESEGIRFEPPALLLLAHAAQGSLRDALSLLDQAIAHGGGGVEQDSVRAMLGVVGHDHLYAILQALARQDGAALMAEAGRMEALSLSFESALQDLASLLHRVSLAQTVPAALSEDDPGRAAVEELARLFSPEDLQLYYQIAIQGRGDLGLAPDEHAGFTMTLLRMLAFAPAGQGVPAPHRTAPQRATNAPPPAGVPESKKNPGDRAWPELVDQLGLTAMALELARHCELVARDASRIELKIAQGHQRLLNGPYQDRLRTALEQHFGTKLRLSIQVAGDAGGSPAAIADREKQQRQVQAVAAIEQDPFVRELVDNFDARIVGSSIKPVQ